MKDTPYKDPELPIHERVEDLLGRMTLKEKVAQLFHHWKTDENNQTFEKYKADGVGSVYIFWVDDLVELQRFCLEETRLGIPANVVTEALHGGCDDGTIFPMPGVMSATWNPELLLATYQHIAKEARLSGANQTMSPNSDVMTDPRFGRVDEGFGEDPFLGAVFTDVAVRGMQGEKSELLGPESISATVKHFAAYGMAENGQDGGAADLSEQVLRERYLPPFKAAVDAGAKALMPAHSEINGVPCHANTWLLQDLLREEWGFEGMVVADAGDCNLLCAFGMAVDFEDAGVQCLSAGVDQELYVTAYEHLENAVLSGKLDESIVDRSVRYVLKHKFECGLFENPFPKLVAKKDLDTPHGRQLAYETAVQGMTLLKNEGSFLPLDSKSLKKVALIGPNIDDDTNQLGLYTRGGARVVTIKEGFENHLKGAAEVVCARGCEIMDDSEDLLDEAVEVAKGADAVFLTLGDSLDSCRECYGSRDGDRTSLNLAGGQQRLLNEVYKVNKNVVLLLMHGRPHSIVSAQEKLPAIVAIGRCGEEGGTAIADIVFGEANPSGRLTMTFPRTVGQLPMFYYRKKRSFKGRRYTFESPKPLYPFGFGLSYTDFEWSDLQVTPDQVQDEAEVIVTLTVKNTGGRDGSDVVQIYAHDPLATITRPMRQLVGFERVELLAGEKKTVQIAVKVEQFGYYDRQAKFTLDAGDIEIIAAKNAEDEGLQVTVKIGDTEDGSVKDRSVEDALIPD